MSKSVFTVDENNFTEILGAYPKQLLSVISNEALEIGDGYKLYAEFVSPPQELLAGIRAWIQKQ